MIDLVWMTVASNLLFASLLAIAALAFARWQQGTPIAHALWVLVLVKLVTPPVVSLGPFVLQSHVEHSPVPKAARVEATPRVPLVAEGRGAASAETSRRTAAAAQSAQTTFGHWIRLTWQRIDFALVILSIAGSVVILSYSIHRYRRFQQLLAESRVAVPPGVIELARHTARRLGVLRMPSVRVTGARLSPMILPAFPRPMLVIPQSLLSVLDDEQLQLVLAHELAHIRRGDHYVRLLESACRLLMWWNPLVWLAQRQLRECEEQNCDMFVLTRLNAKAKRYAAAILSAVEAISPPVHRPPAMASAINSGGTLERRMRKMLSNKNRASLGWWSRLLVVVLTLVVLPLGIVSAQDYEKVWKRLQKSVEKGDITEEQADVMMDALRETDREEDEEDWADEDAWEDDEEDFDEEEYERIEHELEGIELRLRMAVHEGEISEEEAHEKWEQVLEEYGIEEDEDYGDEEDSFEELREHLVWAIRTGRVDPERLEEEWDDILEEASEDEEDEWGDDDEDHDDDEDWEEDEDDFDDDNEEEDEEFDEGDE